MLKCNTVRCYLLLIFNVFVASVVSGDVGTDCRLVIAETKCHGEVNTYNILTLTEGRLVNFNYVFIISVTLQ